MQANPFGPEPEHATPLSPDDQLGLIPGWVTTRAELNYAEATNILRAMVNYSRQQLPSTVLLDEHFVRRLHKAMFGNVWTWAGKYRRSETSIGVAPDQISVSVVNLMEDAKYWLSAPGENQIDLEVCRIHHRLVSIHPFPNGNGRMSRMFADLLLQSAGRPAFSWGSENLGVTSDVRARYIRALRSADAGDIAPLAEFVRAP